MSEQEKFIPQFEAPEVSREHSLSKEDYTKQALENLRLTSQAVKGLIDVSASIEKIGAIQEGLSEQKIAERTISNFKETIEYLYEEKDRQFENPEELQSFPEELQSFIEDIA